jgi:hypothetical protein
MSVLSAHGVETVQHYAPLHYLPFIARSGALLSKPSLNAAGFSQMHLRSKSRAQDVVRGFGSYAHLTLDKEPRILKAKLKAGFPHIAINVPISAVEAGPFSLCRFNVAMTRRLKRGKKHGFPESATNGRYYLGHQIPIARDHEDMNTMLNEHLPLGTMIEVLIHGDLRLSDQTTVTCYSAADAKIAAEILTSLQCPWTVIETEPTGEYPRSEQHVEAVTDFVKQALADPAWRGNGLEFDKLR